ncbi:SprT-like domain-containing protein [Planctomycetes bacterium TBK1r]|uniref:SprT-like family protein n=1 Tax=Stieleria magnilauensis TaxID=2527963 RepID=A0ABX5XIP5_9BACT|nr:SprT-like family protein [Planctomycetes bacterium TBK1r]
MEHPKPTRENYAELQRAWDYFNQRLFGKELPTCMITLQRFHKSAGYFVPGGWHDDSGIISDEISLNPAYLTPHLEQGDLKQPLSTLVHEQCHQWQHHYGERKSLRGYHNREWARKMELVGLVASRTGKPGGKKTGYGISHYIEDGGRFEVACQALLEKGFTISWRDNWNRVPKGVKKTHYKCPACGTSCWARPRWAFTCGICNAAMEELG